MAGQRLILQAVAGGAGMVLPIVAAEAQAAPSPAVEFTVPAQPLGDALRAVALQAGRNLLLDDSLVAGRTAAALGGSMTAEAAVATLLAGTGLRSRPVGDTIIIEQDPSATVPVNSVETNSAQTIVVTGTNLRGAPPTSPVIAVSRREIERAAPASVEELVRKLPQNVSAGVGQENFDIAGAGADITDHGAGLNLRGLGQRATLTLVNGRRLAPSGTGSYVDVSLIPVTAIDRIEIVTDGASAIYGSDAVGGVINFILRDDFSGLETFAQAGTTTRGGGGQLLVGVTGGHRWSGGHGLLAYEYRHENEVRAGDREFVLNLPDDWFLFPRERRHSLYGSLEQELGPSLQLELTGFLARRRTLRSFVQGAGALETEAQASALTAGGTAALVWSLGNNWQAELSAGWSRSSDRQVQLVTASGALFNRYNSRNRVADLDLKLTGDLFALPGGSAKLALGGQLRQENFADLFETSVNPADPNNGRRSVQSAYSELLVPLVGRGNRRPGFERLLVTAAARLDRYSAYGASIDPKLGLLWSPLSGLDLRSSYATSFRAPLLSEALGDYNAFLFPTALLYLQPGEAPTGVGTVLVGSNPLVEPETSRSWTVGADWQPPSVPGLQVNFTFYDIRFNNRIALPSQSIVIVGDPALEPIVTRFPAADLTGGLLGGAGQVLDFSGPGFTNGNATPADVVVIVDARTANTASTRTRGLDLLAGYGFTVGSNQLRGDLNINRVLKFTDRLTTTSDPIETLNSPFNPVKWRGRASLGLSRGPASANLFVNYVGPYRDRRASADRRVDSWTTIDLGLAYALERPRGTPGPVRIGFNVQNLLDAKPPRLQPSPTLGRDIGYDPVNANARGRSLSLQLRTSW